MQCLIVPAVEHIIVADVILAIPGIINQTMLVLLAHHPVPLAAAQPHVVLVSPDTIRIVQLQHVHLAQLVVALAAAQPHVQHAPQNII